MVGEIDGVPFWSTSKHPKAVVDLCLADLVWKARSKGMEPILATALQEGDSTQYMVWMRRSLWVRIVLWCVKRGLLR